MRKLCISIVMILTLSLLLCSAASAETITAIAAEINPARLEKAVSYARVLHYDPTLDTLTVELIYPEVFRRDEVLALQPGDAIFTGGREVTVQTITECDEYGMIVINKGDYEFSEGSVWLYENGDGDFEPREYEDKVWLTLAVLNCLVKNSLLFLDGINESTGDPLSLPAVLSAGELKEKLMAEQASEDYSVGLGANNAFVVFDSEGGLALICRYYVPWQ